MGAYLSSPIVDKVSSDEKSDRIVQGDNGEKWTLGYGCSSMQGWRVSQEDAHNAIINFDTDTSLFAVYDGHGGPEVAKYCSLNLPDYLRSVTDYKEGNINKALEETFLQFDSTLTKPEVIADLKRFADIQSGSSADESEDDTRMLNEEAHMPLDQVLARYGGGGADSEIETEPPPEVDSAGCSSSSGSGSSRPNVAKRLAPHLIRYHDQKPKSPMLHAKKSSEPGNSSVPHGDSNNSNNQTEQVDSVSKNENDENDSKNDSVVVVSSEVHNEAKNSLKEKEVPTGNNVNGVSSSDKSTSDVIIGSNLSLKEKDTLPDDNCNSVDSSDFAKSAKKHVVSSVLNSNTDTETGEDGVSSTTLNGESSKKSEDIDEPGCSSTVSSSSASGSGKKKGISNPWVSSNDTESSSGDESEDEDFEGAESDSSNEKIEEDETSDDEEDIEDEDDGEGIEMSLGDHEKPGQDSGCTAVVALLHKNELYVANAGDSRCVLCRDGKAVDMSFDHKPEDDIERQRIVNAGGKVTYDGRVNGGLNLSRAIGDHVYKSNSKLPLRDQMITALPDIQQITIDIEKDDFMVLACDGIWNFMSSQEVIDFVKERLDKDEKLSQICEELFDHCLAPDTDGDGTGCDNMTAIIVKFNKIKSGEETSTSKKRPAQDEAEKTEAENENKKVKLDVGSTTSKSTEEEQD